jgi:predicted ATP-dependent serine protease
MNTETIILSKNYKDVDVLKEPAILTGNEKFDKFFSKHGGMVLKTVILLTGSSGAGKTTLSVFLQKVLNLFRTSFYSREMSASSVKEQTLKIDLNHDNAFICDKTTCKNFSEYMQEVERIQPKVLTIDSIQVIAREDYPKMSEEDAMYLIVEILREWAERTNGVVFIIGHVTKDNEFRGANTLMQMVDAHLEMIHHKSENSRTISWGQKNRKGPMDTLFYTIQDSGIEFFTEQEWVAIKTGTRNFADYISTATSAYVKTLDKSNPNYASFKKEYDGGIKRLEKSCPTTLIFYGEVIKMVVELSAKYKM